MTVACESMSIRQVMYLRLVLDYLYNCVSSRCGPYDDGRRGINLNWTEVGGERLLYSLRCYLVHDTFSRA
jgi:hypothetical protein